MASIKKNDIKWWDVNTKAERIERGQKVPLRLFNRPSPTSNSIDLKQYHSGFEDVVGARPRYSLLLSSDESTGNHLFRNGCVFVQSPAGLIGHLYVMSGPLQVTNSSALPTILISHVTCDYSSKSDPEESSMARDEEEYRYAFKTTSVEWKKLRPPKNMPMPAGACSFGQMGVLYCSQGTLSSDTGGLWNMPHNQPPLPVLTSYLGRPFNSIQNVVKDKKGGLWFTDASTGFELDIRPKPKLPNQVYRVDTDGQNVRVVADGFGRPTGIAVNKDGSTLYVSDTDAIRADGSTDPTRAATIYAFDIIQKSGSSFLTNRRVFAYAREGVPSAVICDTEGRVFAACGDGVEVFSPGGIALGLIEILGGCTTICFGNTDEELIIGSGQRLWSFLMRVPIRGS